VIAFIEPPQGDVIERILRHCGLWHASSPRPPPRDSSGSGGEGDSSQQPRELTFVDIDTFEATL
jgi:hypothetical protein